MEIKYWAGTDVGRKRSENEDNFLIDKRLKLFVVADGMGGHASGEIASAVAVHGIREIIHKERDILDSYDDDDPKSHVEVCTLLEYAVHHTCESIFQKARREPEKRGMGTTLVVLLIIGARGFIAYVGDSRIYLLRGGIVYQLTEDHSLKNELIRMGKITADEFESSPYANLKNAMTRAVGVYESVEADTLDFDIIPGDSFLLCSDGLYEYLSEDEIANAIGLPEIREVPGMLIDSANSRGGKDNITAVVVQVVGDDDDDRAAELNFTLDTLKNVPLFRELSYQQLVRVMNLAKQSAIEPGQALFTEGDVGSELMVVLRGRIALTRDGVQVAEIATGAHLGEMSLIDEGVRSATATALDSGKVLAISRDDFYDVLRREPALAVKLLWSFVRVLAQRLRNTTADLASARSKVAAQFPDLTELAEDAAKSSPELRAIDPDAPEPIVEEIEEVEEVEEVEEIEEIEEEIEEVEEIEENPSPLHGGLTGLSMRGSSLEDRPTMELPTVDGPAIERRTTLISTRTTDIGPSADSERSSDPRGRKSADEAVVTPRAIRPSSRPQTMSAAESTGDAPGARARPPSGPVQTGHTVVPPSRPRPRTTPSTTGDTVVPPSNPRRQTAPSNTPVKTGDTLVPPSNPRRQTAPSNTPPAADAGDPGIPIASPAHSSDRVTIVETGAPVTKGRRKTEPAIPVESLPTRRTDPDVTRPLESAQWPPSAPSPAAPVVPSTGRATVPVEASPPLIPPSGGSGRPKAPKVPKVPRRTASRAAMQPGGAPSRGAATVRPNAPTVSSPAAPKSDVGAKAKTVATPKAVAKPPSSSAAKPPSGPAAVKPPPAGPAAAPLSGSSRPRPKSGPASATPSARPAASSPSLSPAAAVPKPSRPPSGGHEGSARPPSPGSPSEADAPRRRRSPRGNTLRSMPGPPAVLAADPPGTPPPEPPQTHEETIIGHLPPRPGGTAPTPLADLEAAHQQQQEIHNTHVGLPPLPAVPPPPATRTSGDGAADDRAPDDSAADGPPPDEPSPDDASESDA